MAADHLVMVWTEAAKVVTGNPMAKPRNCKVMMQREARCMDQPFRNFGERLQTFMTGLELAHWSQVG